MSEIKFEKVSLRKLVKIKNGKDHQELKTGIYPVYGSGGIIRYVDKYMYDKESILLPRKGSLNNIQFASKPFWTVDTCYYTEVNEEKVLPYYLFKILSRYDIEMLNTGSAVPSMTFEKYYSIEIKLPSKNYQTKVVNQLKSYDDLIENNQKQIKLLEEAAQRLYKEWFVDLRFPGHENVKIIDGVPEGWVEVSLKKLAFLKAGGDKPKLFFHKKNERCTVPVYSNGINNDGLYGYTDKPSIMNHSVTITARGNVGFVCLHRKPYFPIVRLISVVPININLFYLYFYLKNSILDGNGSAQQQITIPMIEAQNVIIPNEMIINNFSVIATSIFDEIDALRKKIELLMEARDRLLPKLMSGDIEL